MKQSLLLALKALAVAACFAGVVAGVLALTILVCGCGSPQTQAGAANRQTHLQTSKVQTQVNAAENHNANADARTTEVANDPRLPPDLREKLVTAHQEHVAVAEALKPIVPDILPRINDAADRALAAEQRAQNATTGKVYLIAAFAVGVGIAIAVAHAGCGLGISIAVGAVSAVLMGVVVGSISALFDLWFPWIVGAALVGAAVWAIEAHFKGGLLPAIHAWFDRAKAEAKKMPEQLADLRGRLAAIEAASNGFTPTPDPAKAA